MTTGASRRVIVSAMEPTIGLATYLVLLAPMGLILALVLFGLRDHQRRR